MYCTGRVKEIIMSFDYIPKHLHLDKFIHLMLTSNPKAYIFLGKKQTSQLIKCDLCNVQITFRIVD